MDVPIKLYLGVIINYNYKLIIIIIIPRKNYNGIHNPILNLSLNTPNVEEIYTLWNKCILINYHLLVVLFLKLTKEVQLLKQKKSE